jgi:hypothetical protein
MHYLPCGKLARSLGFPQVFPTTFPQGVDKSVDIFAKMWKDTRVSRLFWGFSWVKSAFWLVDKSYLVLFQFPADWGKVVGNM